MTVADLINTMEFGTTVFIYSGYSDLADLDTGLLKEYDPHEYQNAAFDYGCYLVASWAAGDRGLAIRLKED